MCEFCSVEEMTNPDGRIFYQVLPHVFKPYSTLDQASLQLACDGEGWVLHFEDESGDVMFDVKITICPICGRKLEVSENE